MLQYIKRIGYNLLVDIAGGFLVGIGIYNFSSLWQESQVLP